MAAEIIFSSVGDEDSKKFYPIYMRSKNLKVYDSSLTRMVVDDLLKSFLNDYQFSLRRKKTKFNIAFDRDRTFYYKLLKISLNRTGGLYIDSPVWIKSKKATINPKNKSDDKCMQYAISTALAYEKIDNHPERISEIKPFINMYDWKDINFPSHKKDWNTFEKNNRSFALNIFYVPYNTKQIRPAYISKYTWDRENQANFLMITDGKKRHYLAIVSIPKLFRGITSKNNGDFLLFYMFLFRTKNSLKNHENVWKNHDYYCIEMPNEENNILKYNLGGKSMKMPLIIYSDFESILEEISTCGNDLKKSSTTKISKYTPSGFSLVTYCSFDKTKNKPDYYREKDCMKVFCKILREHVERIIYWEKNK